jgi:lysophospholipase L1-like esterase
VAAVAARVAVAVAVLVVALGGSLPPASAQAVIRVMPLGDSNTEGVPASGGGYRTELGRLVQQGGGGVDFVGSRSSGPATLFDRDHEGHSGYTIAQAQGQVQGWLDSASPDVVLLMLGTNDLKGAAAVSPSVALDRLRTLIGTIRSHRSSPHVIVSTIPPQPAIPALVAEFNAGLPGVVAAAGARVSLVNAGGSVAPAQLLPDGIHPNATGYAVIGAAFHQALAPLIPTGGTTGYWAISSQGDVYPFGSVESFGPAPGAVGAATVDIEATPSGRGYWALDERGNVTAAGDAPRLPGTVSLQPGERAVSMSATPDGGGYWVFTDRGRATPFGTAPPLPDVPDVLGDRPLNGPVLDSVATPSGRGYYMVASDGGIFTFGDARFRGSMGGQPLNAPVQSLAPDPDGLGYWLVASDGGVFAFDAPFRGSVPGALGPGRRLNAPVVGMVSYGNGYLMVASDGGIFNFSNRAFAGSLGDKVINAPIVAVAAR